MDEAIGAVTSRMSTMRMRILRYCLVVHYGMDAVRGLMLIAAQTMRHKHDFGPSLPGGFPGPCRYRQLLPRSDPAGHDAACLQPADTRAGGVGRGNVVRP